MSAARNGHGSLGQALWQRHMTTALTATAHGASHESLGAALHARHADFARTMLRRTGADGGRTGAASGPFVIARRALPHEETGEPHAAPDARARGGAPAAAEGGAHVAGGSARVPTAGVARVDRMAARGAHPASTAVARRVPEPGSGRGTHADAPGQNPTGSRAIEHRAGAGMAQSMSNTAGKLAEPRSLPPLTPVASALGVVPPVKAAASFAFEASRVLRHADQMGREHEPRMGFREKNSQERAGNPGAAAAPVRTHESVPLGSVQRETVAGSRSESSHTHFAASAGDPALVRSLPFVQPTDPADLPHRAHLPTQTEASGVSRASIAQTRPGTADASSVQFQGQGQAYGAPLQAQKHSEPPGHPIPPHTVQRPRPVHAGRTVEHIAEPYITRSAHSPGVFRSEAPAGDRVDSFGARTAVSAAGGYIARKPSLHVSASHEQTVRRAAAVEHSWEGSRDRATIDWPVRGFTFVRHPLASALQRVLDDADAVSTLARDASGSRSGFSSDLRVEATLPPDQRADRAPGQVGLPTPVFPLAKPIAPETMDLSSGRSAGNRTVPPIGLPLVITSGATDRRVSRSSHAPDHIVPGASTGDSVDSAGPASASASRKLADSTAYFVDHGAGAGTGDGPPPSFVGDTTSSAILPHVVARQVTTHDRSATGAPDIRGASDSSVQRTDLGPTARTSVHTGEPSARAPSAALREPGGTGPAAAPQSPLVRSLPVSRASDVSRAIARAILSASSQEDRSGSDATRGVSTRTASDVAFASFDRGQPRPGEIFAPAAVVSPGPSRVENIDRHVEPAAEPHAFDPTALLATQTTQMSRRQIEPVANPFVLAGHTEPRAGRAEGRASDRAQAMALLPLARGQTEVAWIRQNPVRPAAAAPAAPAVQRQVAERSVTPQRTASPALTFPLRTQHQARDSRISELVNTQWPGQSTGREPLPVDRFADQYGVVPLALQAAPGPGPAAPPSAPPAAAHPDGAAEAVKAAGAGTASAARNAQDGGSADELAEQAWRIIMDRLAIEQERRGYASWA